MFHMLLFFGHLIFMHSLLGLVSRFEVEKLLHLWAVFTLVVVVHTHALLEFGHHLCLGDFFFFWNYVDST
jgi:hypothetical protein